MKNTLTIHECCEYLRAHDVHISEDTLGDMIVAGKFPFAVGIGGERRKYIIFAHKLTQWVEEMIGGNNE